MKLRITSDGKPHGTKVCDEDTFTDLSKFVRSVTFQHRAGCLPVAEIELSAVEVNAIGGMVKWVIPGLGTLKAVTLEDGTTLQLDDLGLLPQVPPP